MSQLTNNLLRVTVMAAMVCAASAHLAHADPADDVPYYFADYVITSGEFDGQGEEGELVFSTDIEMTDATWIRFHLEDFNLGEHSYLVITSYHDGHVQRFSHETLTAWNGWSAFFNGDAVQVELYAARGDRGIFIDFDQIMYGEIGEGGEPITHDEGGVATLCGADNRVASGDNAVGRLFLNGGCTAWIIGNGAMLTAGHCVDSDPDGSGPLLPDGVLQGGFTGGVVGFNIPNSSANGAPTAPAPQDQYPVASNVYVAWQFPGTNANTSSLGFDWCVFAVAPNSNGVRAPIAQNAFWRVSSAIPNDGDTIRITGYGVDWSPAGPGGGGAPCCDSDGDGNCNFTCNSANLTLQTSTGSYGGYDASNPGPTHFYNTDTMPANSGSPVIRTTSNRAVGIHTNGGCQANGSGNNAGCSFQNSTLRQFVNNFLGAGAVYIDSVAACPQGFNFCSGSLFNPYQTLQQAVDAVPAGANVGIITGSYSSALPGNAITITKAMTLRATVGIVTIGN